MHENKQWWGEFTFTEQPMQQWSIGERKIVIQRLPSEWNTWNIEAEVETDSQVALIHCASTQQETFDDEILERHLQTVTADKVRVAPALADRSIVTRPNVPLRLLGGEETRIFVSTPLWFTAQTLPGESRLLDIPFWRPSDSWFGPSTRVGEMCYAKHTEARLKLELLEQRPHRAITAVLIHNTQAEPLLIERLNLPVPLLSLYHHPQRGLWTEAINIVRQKHDDSVELTLEKHAPVEVSNAERIAGPRIASDKHIFLRNLASLFA